MMPAWETLTRGSMAIYQNELVPPGKALVTQDKAEAFVNPKDFAKGLRRIGYLEVLWIKREVARDDAPRS